MTHQVIVWGLRRQIKYCLVLTAIKNSLNLIGETIMSEPSSGSCTAVALAGATVFGLFTGMDFGIVFGAFAETLFVAIMPQILSPKSTSSRF